MFPRRVRWYALRSYPFVFCKYGRKFGLEQQGLEEGREMLGGLEAGKLGDLVYWVNS